MPSDTNKQNDQDQQASELQTDQLDEAVGGRLPVVGGTKKGGGGKTGDPCAGGE